MKTNAYPILSVLQLISPFFRRILKIYNNMPSYFFERCVVCRPEAPIDRLENSKGESSPFKTWSCRAILMMPANGHSNSTI
jgi:hypothetical protein